MDFLLYHHKTKPTGRVIADALRVRHGFISTYPASVTNRRLRSAGRVGTLIRWGSQKPIPVEADAEVNKPAALALASDKYRSLVALKAAGVPVPPFDRDPGRLEGCFLGRAYKGSQGRDITVYYNMEDFNARGGHHDFYSQFVPNRREYRVHVVGETIIRVQGKYLDIPEAHRIPQVKNHAQGFRFREPSRTLNRERTDAAVAAVSALGLDFGAVDLLIGEDGGTYVLEVNTAPGCSPLTLRAYAEALRRFL